MCVLVFRGLWGSSPLTRGGLVVITFPPLGMRLIPAYAGRTLSHFPIEALDWAHPRLRGADILVEGVPHLVAGSSPLTRGGLVSKALKTCGTGLIPAYAGRTVSPFAPIPPPWAHPRLRGADDGEPLMTLPEPGSSPLTRGGLLRLAGVFRVGGLIPAYAGRTLAYNPIICHPGAHPRLRGADLSRRHLTTHVLGSSPLTRGGRG